MSGMYFRKTLKEIDIEIFKFDSPGHVSVVGGLLHATIQSVLLHPSPPKHVIHLSSPFPFSSRILRWLMFQFWPISLCSTRVPGKEFLALVIRLLSLKLHTLPQNGLLLYFMIRMSYLVKEVWFLRRSQEVLFYWQRLIFSPTRSHV